MHLNIPRPHRLGYLCNCKQNGSKDSQQYRKNLLGRESASKFFFFFFKDWETHFSKSWKFQMFGHLL